MPQQLVEEVAVDAARRRDATALVERHAAVGAAHDRGVDKAVARTAVEGEHLVARSRLARRNRRGDSQPPIRIAPPTKASALNAIQARSRVASSRPVLASTALR